MLDLLKKNETVSSICCECSRRIVLTIEDVSYILESDQANLPIGHKSIVGRCWPCARFILDGETYIRHYSRGI